ncbi:MAG TPA: AI-2E family transporter [Gemmatimonadales bacterium]|nr:AI-2E family transporter [Gemmatimonadales bacterium]HRZ09286.1 AI-2E family transporter [Gemmatimonadales bacterium]
MSDATLSPLYRSTVLVACVIIIAAALHAAAATVNLLLISVLLAMSVSPITYWLERRGRKHATAVLLTIVGSLVIGVFVVGTLGRALSGLQDKLPTYQAALTSLLAGLEGFLTARGVDVHEVLKPDTARMVAVVQRVVGGALSALGYSFFALILVALILLELPARKDAEGGAGGMRSRFDEVSVSVRRFVALTGLIGAGLAVVNLVAMLALGTDFPMVWAVLLFLLNFVPFGFAIAMLPPVAVTLLEHGVTRAAILLGVLLVSNLLSDNVVKPKLMGSGFGLSPLLIVVSLMFWAFVLGPVGAILAVPLTITITTLAPFFTGDVKTG